jgi:hypothetical protein
MRCSMSITSLRKWDGKGVPTKETFEKPGLHPEYQALARAIEGE